VVDAVTSSFPAAKPANCIISMRMLRTIAGVICCGLIALCVSCGGDEHVVAPATATAIATAVVAADEIELRYDGGVLRVELAITAQERAAGLSNRDSLADDAGMLFVFERARIPSFWMKDTRIPLDMIWIGEDKRIVEIDADVQPEPGVADADLKRYGPDVPVAYGLEVNAGTAARLGLRPGSQVAFDLPAP
jgi:uncharacterized protein